MDDDDLDGESRRQAARREQRVAGDRSARVARKLMGLPEAAVGKLKLDDELGAVVARARAVTATIARRRAERTLAGALLRADLADLERRLANVEAAGAAEPRLFKLAERWRARLIDEGPTAAAELPGGPHDDLPGLIHQARRERDTGKPRGAARALFRHVFALLEADSRAAASGDAADDGDAGDDEA
jgi:ribosome-associated protein